MTTAAEIRRAVDAGFTVHSGSPAYRVIKDSLGQYLIQHTEGHCVGLTWTDGETLNGTPEGFYIAFPLPAGTTFVRDFLR